MMLVIRADGGARHGTGHVLRCMALAQEYVQRGGEVRFLSDVSPGLEARLRQAGYDVERIEGPSGGRLDEAAWVRSLQDADHAIIDGYHLPPGFQDQAVDAATPCLVLDDGGRVGRYRADVVVDPGLGGTAPYADRSPGTRLLVGPQYAPLREEFARHRPVAPPRAERLENVLVTLGGATPADVVHSVLDGIPSSLDAVVLLGSDQPGREELRQRTSSHRTFIDATTDMAGHMLRADVAILAGGSTNWEACCMGLPRLMVRLADNQEAIVDGLCDQGIGMDLGHPPLSPAKVEDALVRLAEEPHRLHGMAERAWRLVDGAGAGRILDHLGVPR